jgi:hypothetical protein
MTGAHSRTDEDPVQSVLGNVGCLLLLASVLALVGLFAYLLATDSKDLPIPLMALQGLVVITYARRLALKILRNRSPSPVILADWISESARDLWRAGGRGPLEASRHDADYTLRCERANVVAIVIYRQEVSPVNAVSAVGAPLQSTIARLR